MATDEKQTGSTLLERWKADDRPLTADELLAALIYARAANDPSAQRLDLAERTVRRTEA